MCTYMCIHIHVHEYVYIDALGSAVQSPEACGQYHMLIILVSTNITNYSRRYVINSKAYPHFIKV